MIMQMRREWGVGYYVGFQLYFLSVSTHYQILFGWLLHFSIHSFVPYNKTGNFFSCNWLSFNYFFLCSRGKRKLEWWWVIPSDIFFWAAPKQLWQSCLSLCSMYGGNKSSSAFGIEWNGCEKIRKESQKKYIMQSRKLKKRKVKKNGNFDLNWSF